MSAPKAGRLTGIQAFGTPSAGEIVGVDGKNGKATRRATDGSAVWVRLENERADRMFTYRAALDAFREFPERVGQGPLTIGRGGW